MSHMGHQIHPSKKTPGLKTLFGTVQRVDVAGHSFSITLDQGENTPRWLRSPEQYNYKEGDKERLLRLWKYWKISDKRTVHFRANFYGLCFVLHMDTIAGEGDDWLRSVEWAKKEMCEEDTAIGSVKEETVKHEEDSEKYGEKAVKTEDVEGEIIAKG